MSVMSSAVISLWCNDSYAYIVLSQSFMLSLEVFDAKFSEEEQIAKRLDRCTPNYDYNSSSSS